MHMNFGDGHRNPVCRGQEEIENNFTWHSVLVCIFTPKSPFANGRKIHTQYVAEPKMHIHNQLPSQ